MYQVNEPNIFIDYSEDIIARFAFNMLEEADLLKPTEPQP